MAVFPLMAKGHTIPLLDLACLLRRRELAAVTVFSTAGSNAAFIRDALAKGGAGDAAVVELPFPDGGGAPGGSVEGVASASTFSAFAESTALLRARFEEALSALRPPARLLVADGFLYWAHASAAALGVPRLSFLGSSAFAHVVWQVCMRDKPGAAPPPHQEEGRPGCYAASTGTYTVPELPHLQFRLAELAPVDVASSELHAKAAVAVAASQGMLINTFPDLEGRYIEHWTRHIGPRAWPVGPLCLARRSSSAYCSTRPSWMQWLDDKAAAGHAVLYIALGTLAAIPEVQLKEVAEGLDRADVDFLWAVRPSNADLGSGFEERVQGRGQVVREWVDQREILEHACIKGFLSHGGWNSVLESVAAGVPMVIWPVEFEQPINAAHVVDELKVGIRLRTGDGRFGSLVESEEVTRVVRELMLGDAGVAVSASVKAMGARARLAMEEGGSSWKEVEEMITELCM